MTAPEYAGQNRLTCICFGNIIKSSILAELESLKPDYLPNLKCSEEAKQFIDSFISSWKDYKETGEGSTVVINFDNNIKQIHRATVN